MAWCFRCFVKLKVAGHLHKATCASHIHYKRWDPAAAEVLVLLHASLLLEIPPVHSPLFCSSESPTCGSLFRAAKFQDLCHRHSCCFSSKLYMEKCKCAFLALSGTVCQGYQVEGGKCLESDIWDLQFLEKDIEGRNEGQKGFLLYFFNFFFLFQRWQQKQVILCICGERTMRSKDFSAKSTQWLSHCVVW